jgi:hypothetical protein
VAERAIILTDSNGAACGFGWSVLCTFREIGYPGGMTKGRPYPGDVSDKEWSFVVPYLTSMNKEAPQPKHELLEVFNALRWTARAGIAWRMLLTNSPPWEAVYQHTRRGLETGCFERW